MVRDQIALAYSDCGEWTAAIEEQYEAVRRFPRFAVAHKALAHAAVGRALEDAVARFRQAVRLDPRFSSAYLFLGRALIETGEFREAARCPGPRRPRPAASRPISQRRRSVFSRQGNDDSGSTASRGPGGMRDPGRRPRGGVVRPARFREAPACGSGSPVGRVFHKVARARSRADHGKSIPGRRPRRWPGPNVGPNSPPETLRRARWRKQAIDWLNADLTASAAVLNTGAFRERAAVSKRLGRWHVDPALAGIRDEPASHKSLNRSGVLSKNSGAASRLCVPRRRLQSPQALPSARKCEGGCNISVRFPNSL